MMLSKGQLALFWRVWAAAEREALPASATKAERDTFRRGVIRRAAGVDSLKAVEPGKAFGRLMHEAAVLADDVEAAIYWCNDAERRYAHMMTECARQIGEIAGAPHGWEYCRATLLQAGLPQGWEDVAEPLLAGTFKMLDTHRRRLLRREPGWGGGGRPLGFSLNRRYWRNGGQLVFSDNAPPGAAGCGRVRSNAVEVTA